ncbi:uncharacterized protein BCR38DRAFT_482563 [Pseudomassariella vexata]|uniref:Transferase family-domain-containing protein n=1 Tax=Pseudomassariella vexata TaxID=1141098 RepID=A0A1Y2EBY8_9PEZI|nr:uncharacterized protein BCR38DRAFT_482563 [Pseudomassariella vexata]ORY69093.1 hypothetical protein BCR38DRAFT_482563 [Pseudomassariella vexata]
MRNPFRNKPVAPVTVSSDTVIPVASLDDNAVYQTVVVNPLFRFDDVLDAVKLRRSLEKLLDRQDWRKLGARLRRNQENGKLDYHIPAKYDDRRPAISYSHIEYAINIAEHPLASRLPKPTTKPAVVGDPDEFHDLSRRANAPKALGDYLYADEPLLSLHIVSFCDATLVSLLWLHVVMDAVGFKAMLNAWSLVLQGRDDEVPPLLGVGNDPLANLGLHSKEPYKLADRLLIGWRMAVFGIRFAFGLLWWRGNEHRMICIPGSYLQTLRETALQELAIEGENPFLSEGDVLCAWTTRLAVSHLRRDSHQTLPIANAYNFRAVVAGDLLPPPGVYVSNVLGLIYAFLSVRDIFAKPLSYTALIMRRAIGELGSRDQVEAYLAVQAESLAKTGYPALFGDATMHMVTHSNWTQAKLFETDFGPAVVGACERDAEGRGRTNKLGTPSYVQCVGVTTGFPLRNVFLTSGKDAEGNYWVAGYLRKGLWARIDDMLKAG